MKAIFTKTIHNIKMLQRHIESCYINKDFLYIFLNLHLHIILLLCSEKFRLLLKWPKKGRKENKSLPMDADNRSEHSLEGTSMSI